MEDASKDVSDVEEARMEWAAPRELANEKGG